MQRQKPLTHQKTTNTILHRNRNKNNNRYPRRTNAMEQPRPIVTETSPPLNVLMSCGQHSPPDRSSSEPSSQAGPLGAPGSVSRGSGPKQGNPVQLNVNAQNHSFTSTPCCLSRSDPHHPTPPCSPSPGLTPSDPSRLPLRVRLRTKMISVGQTSINI